MSEDWTPNMSIVCMLINEKFIYRQAYQQSSIEDEDFMGEINI